MFHYVQLYVTVSSKGITVIQRYHTRSRIKRQPLDIQTLSVLNASLGHQERTRPCITLIEPSFSITETHDRSHAVLNEMVNLIQNEPVAFGYNPIDGFIRKAAVDQS